MIIKFVLLVLIGHISFDLISTDYLYQILPGNLFNNSGFNFSIIIENSSGVIIYGIDSNNDQLLIEIVKKEINQSVIEIKSNKLKTNETIKNLCQCDICSNIYVEFILQLNRSQIIIICERKFNLLKFEKKKLKNQFDGYPTQKDFRIETNKTAVMIGNIGYYKGFGDKVYHANKNQIRACLNKFFFNEKRIYFTGNSSQINLFCQNKYKEIICKDESCHEKSVSYDVDDCSLGPINSRYCSEDPPIFSNLNNPFHFNENNTEPILLRIEWKSLFISNYCLLEIKLKNETFVLFHISIHGDILINIKYRQSFIHEKILTKISFNDIHVLLINFNYPNFTIKILNKDNIHTFIDEFIDYPISFNVGMSKSFNICKTFVGALGIRYDPKQINDSIQFSEIKINPESKLNNFPLLSVAGIIIGCFILISICGLIIIIKMSTKHSTEHDNTARPIHLTPKKDLSEIFCDRETYETVKDF